MRHLQSIIQEGLQFFDNGEYDKAEFIFDRLLAANPEESELMGLLGSLYSKLGKNGAAITMLSRAVESGMDEGRNNPGFWSNLATVLKRENHPAEAEAAFTQGMSFDPENQNLLANFSGMYINAGQPEKAEELARKVIELHDRKPPLDFIQIGTGPAVASDGSNDDVPYHLARHHLGLALLEMGRWPEAWTYYDARKTTEGWKRPDYSIPAWKGEETGTLVIHGEQGIGDEVMYCSLIDRIRSKAKRIVVECTPRMLPLFRRSLGVECFTSMEAIQAVGIKPDHVIAMGSLPGVLKLERRQAKSDGYLKPDPMRVDYWRNVLTLLAKGKPIIALAWTGGVQQTHKALRNPPRELFKALDPNKYFLVSVQYTPNAGHQAMELGAWHCQPAIDDLDEQCALIAASDCLVTVAQTAMHFAGATRTPCIGLIASKPRWDCIGETESEMPWWSSVKLIRQKGDDWAGVFDRLNQELESRYAPQTVERAAE